MLFIETIHYDGVVFCVVVNLTTEYHPEDSKEVAYIKNDDDKIQNSECKVCQKESRNFVVVFFLVIC